MLCHLVVAKLCVTKLCVCVYHLHRCKTSFYCRGPPGSQGVGGQRRHPLGTCENVPAYTGLSQEPQCRVFTYLRQTWHGAKPRTPNNHNFVFLRLYLTSWRRAKPRTLLRLLIWAYLDFLDQFPKIVSVLHGFRTCYSDLL